MIARQSSSPRVLYVMEVQRPSKKTWLKNNQPSSHSNRVCESIDSGVGSFEDEPCQGKGMTTTIETPDPAELQEGPQNGEAAQKFQFIFLGFAVLDRRYTQSMLPWIISEVRRRREKQNVYLCVEESTVKALNVADGATTFQHRVQSITRCARSTDKKCFAYLVKSNDSNCSCHCYVFESVDNFSVPGFIHQIKETVRGGCDQADGKPKRKVSSFESTSTSSNSVDGVQQRVVVTYPLTYVGRVSVSHRQAPPTLIDDSVQRFKNLNRRMQLENELHGSNNHQIVSRQSNVSITKRQSPPELPKNTIHQRAQKAASLEGDAIIGECNPETLPKLEDSLPDSPSASNGEVRPRSASDGDKNHFKPGVTKGRADSDHTTRQTHTRSASFGANSENRNVVIQISPMNVMVTSSITNACLMDKMLREISFCQQGTKNPEHFGFICREPRQSTYICFVFKGDSENLVDSVMRSLKQAFHAAWQATGTTNVCEACPLHHLHQLCTQLEGASTNQQHDILQKQMVLLTEEETNLFTDRYKAASPFSEIQEEVEVIMAALRNVYEQRQLLHTHSNSSQQKDKAGSNLLQKAKKSLASSLENFRSKRGRSRTTLREDSVEENTSSSEDPSRPSPSSRRRSHTIDTLGSGPTPPMSPIDEKPPVSTIGAHSNNQRLHQRRGVIRNKSTDSLPETFGSGSSPPHTPTKPTAQMHRKLSRQHSYRQNIFNSVVTPSKRHSSVSSDNERTISWSEMVGRKRSSQELRALWRKIIMEQILLIRMDRENKTLDDIQKSVELKRLKLAYDGPSCSAEAAEQWEKLLSSPSDVKIDKFLLQEAVKAGVPKARRGEVWVFLANQYMLDTDEEQSDSWQKGTYGKMRDGHCLHQHSIFIDLGRTFPSHPFFMSQFGPGQLSLFNLLKAYSVQDTEVGYCQGLSFVAGILLMHMDENQAFDTMCHLMYNLNLRKLYKSDMQELQIQFYMLSRLLHDYHPELYSLLEELEITPTLYSAAWFLTLFASMFSVAFVVRVMDMIFLHGLTVVFKVMLAIFGRCKEEIMSSDGFENAMEVIKTALPPYAVKNMESIVKEVLNIDVARRLDSYQIEYNVLREEDLSLASIEEFEHERAIKLEIENTTLSRHLQELTEQVSSARKTIHSLETTIHTMQMNQADLLSHIRGLEAENQELKKSRTGGAKTSPASRNLLTRADSIETPDAPPLSPQEQSSLTDSFEHLGCNDLTDDEALSLDRDSPADELADKVRARSPLLNEKTDDMAVSR